MASVAEATTGHECQQSQGSSHPFLQHIREQGRLRLILCNSRSKPFGPAPGGCSMGRTTGPAGGGHLARRKPRKRRVKTAARVSAVKPQNQVILAQTRGTATGLAPREARVRRERRPLYPSQGSLPPLSPPVPCHCAFNSCPRNDATCGEGSGEAPSPCLAVMCHRRSPRALSQHTRQHKPGGKRKPRAEQRRKLCKQPSIRRVRGEPWDLAQTVELPGKPAVVWISK